MIKKKIKILIFQIFILFFFTYISNAQIFIVAKINNEIITNFDLLKESKYLKILNPNISKLDDEKILELAKKSLVTEIIKTKELKKVIDVNSNNPYTQKQLENLYKSLGFENEDQFNSELKKNNNYSIEQIKKKIKIELFWNEFIYARYNNQLKINKTELINKVNNKKSEKQKEFLLSEIIFTKKKNEPLENLIKQIKESINEIGFNNTASIYSISDSSKLGGKLGWIKQDSLSKLISSKLENLKENDYSDVITLGNNFLILKIDQIRINETKIDKKRLLAELIKNETNNQLNQFSRIYFDKIKMNYKIDEK